jgi:Domain of unknown function (DUF4160)
MPEVSRFYGIIVRMYVETGEQHHRPHLHAYYQGTVAIFAIDVFELLAGSLPPRQARWVDIWARSHQRELRGNWDRLQEGRPPRRIEPLR